MSEPRATSTPDDELVLVEDRGSWAVLTLNRPEKRNAMGESAQRRLRAALQEVREKRVVVLTGVGPSFCAGIDLVEARQGRATRSLGDELAEDSWARCNDELRQHPAVFIAAVNGYALGGGSTLINNCELAVAAESATIGTPEVGFGAWPSPAGPALINRVLPKHAAEIILMAKPIDAQTAHRMGIVNEVVPDDELLARATELAEHIAQHDPTALAWAKRAFRKMVNMSWEESQEFSRYIVSAIESSRTGQDGGSTLNDLTAGDAGIPGRSPG